MNLHKILANAVVLAGFVLVPFIPFIVLGQTTFFPYIVGKNFAFRIVVEIMFSAWIVLAFIDPAYRPRKGYILGAFVALLGIISLSAFLGENPAKSFWSNFERMEGVVTYLHLFGYFIVASTVLTARDLWRQYLNLHLAAGAIMALYALATLVGQPVGFRISGPLGNSSYLGIYAFFNIFIAVFLMVRESFTTAGEKARISIYGSIVILQTVVLYYTGTRGAVLGLMVGAGLATLLIAIFESKRKTLRLWAVGALVALALVVGGFIAMRDSAFVKETPLLSRFSEISISNFSKNARVMVWGMAYEGFKERPILGWGMENFNFVFNEYYDPNMWGQEQWFDRAHNVFFDWLIAGGVLGLLGYLSLFGCAVYCIWRRADELSVVEKSVLTGLLGGYFFQNIFVFDNLTSLIYFGTILAYIDSLARKEEVSAKEKKLMAGEEDLTIFISGGAVILAMMLIYSVNYNGFKQNTTLIRALSERSDKGAIHNLNLMKETIAYDSFGTSEAREQLASFSTAAFDASKGISEIQKQFIDLAKSELEIQAEKLPNDARYQLFAGSFLAKTGELDKALKYLNSAVELSPTKQTMLFELGSAYYSKKDTAKTEEIFKRAYELAPEFEQAEKFYLQILTANGKKAEAEKILKARPVPNVKL
ncbi:MAG: O-antigen ligase family protein [Minisyncoccia bacterium]